MKSLPQSLQNKSFMIGGDISRQGTILHYLLRQNNLRSYLLSKYNIEGSYPINNYKLFDFEIPYLRFFRNRIRYADIGLQMHGKKRFRSKVDIYWFHGSELRRGLANPSSYNFISQQELFNYIDNAILLPRVSMQEVLEDRKLPPIEIELPEDEIIIGHFPTNPDHKGTNEIFSQLEIAEFDYILLTNSRTRHLVKKYNLNTVEFPYLENLEYRFHAIKHAMSLCDVLIDSYYPEQANYNLISIEAVALGIPSLCHFDPDIADDPKMAKYIGNIKDITDLNSMILEFSQKNMSSYKSEFHSLDNLWNTFVDTLDRWDIGSLL